MDLCNVLVTLNHPNGKATYEMYSMIVCLGTEVNVPGHGNLKVDIGYGGAFYAFISAQEFGLDVRTSRIQDVVNVATSVANAVKAQVPLNHPDCSDLAFLYGVIVTDGQDAWSDKPTANICVFADAQVSVLSVATVLPG